MTKFSIAASAIFMASTLSLAKGESCISGSYDLTVQDECTYDSLLAAFEERYPSMLLTAGCGPNTAEEELWAQLGATDEASAKAAVRAVCEGAWDGANTFDFQDIARSGETDYEQRYYNGGTDWNEETETLYPDGERRNVLRRDAARVREFYEQDSEHIRVNVPTNGDAPLTNNVDPATCSTNAVMCCWSRDRQANDGNGNCGSPYDLNCIDKDPADNTDLCYVDMERGSVSTGMDSTGTMFFPGGNNDGEGPIHCHGYAWGEDIYDHTARYAMNNLFFVSMYDHMTQRGYVENVPGAPMCACTDQMPVVSRSDCTQIDIVTEEYAFHYSGSEMSAKLVDVEIDFNSCQGHNNQNNDLWAYMQRLYYTDRKVSSDKLAALAKTLVEDNNCPFASEQYLYDAKGLIKGYKPDPTKWIQVAGRDSLESPGVGWQAFNKLVASIEHPEPNADVKILMRKCEGCERETHQTIFYRRTTPIPDNCDLLDLLKNSYRKAEQVDSGCNTYLTDFTLHSSYDDALAGTNKWLCDPDATGVERYYYERGFPGDCSPDGTRVYDEDSQIDLRWGEDNVGWYLEKGTLTFTDVGTLRDSLGLTPLDIGGPRLAGSTTIESGTETDPLNVVYHVSGSGDDIWNTRDQFHFAYQQVDATKDFYVKTRLIDMGSLEKGDYDHAKAGIMIRESLEPGSRHCALMARIRYGIDFYWRALTDNRTYNKPLYSDYRDVDTGFMILSKKGSEISAFFSHDGLEYMHVYSQTMESDATTFYVGFSITSHDNSDLTTGTFDNYIVETDKFMVLSAVLVDNTPVAPADADGGAAATPSVNMDAGRGKVSGGRKPGMGGGGAGRPGGRGKTGGREGETTTTATTTTTTTTGGSAPEPYDNTEGAEMEVEDEDENDETEDEDDQGEDKPDDMDMETEEEDETEEESSEEIEVVFEEDEDEDDEEPEVEDGELPVTDPEDTDDDADEDDSNTTSTSSEPKDRYLRNMHVRPVSL